MKLRTKKIISFALTFAILIAFWIPVDAAGITFDDPPTGFTGVAGVNLEVNEGYAWHTMTQDEATTYGLAYEANTPVYIAGNCKVGQKVSNLAIKVTEPGSLTFEYAFSGKENYGALFFLGYIIDSEISDTTAAALCNVIADGVEMPENGAWPTCMINVDEGILGSDGEAIIYIAYKHYSYDGTILDLAAIRNVQYVTGDRDNVIRFEAGSESMGTVTARKRVVKSITTDEDGNEEVTYAYETADINKLEQGSVYCFNAVANEGYQFYGWCKHSGATTEYHAEESGELAVTIDPTTYYTPIFAAAGTYLLRSGNTFYDSSSSLKTVIESATSGDVLVLLKDSTVSEDITVPAGVTLYVPFRAEWEKEEAGFYDRHGNFYLYYHLSAQRVGGKTIVGEEKTYVRLTVNEGTTLTVNGEVVIGAVLGQASQGLQNHVSGTHGRITNNGTIEINDGGTLKCYGIVDGNGLVYANDGADVKEAFIIADYAGGSNTAQFFFNEQMPFKRYSMQSVQCTLKMEAGSNLVAMMSIWALSAFNRTEITLMGSDSDAAFLTDSEKSDTLVLTRTYNGNNSLTNVTTGASMNGVSGIGRTEWTFTGGLTFQAFTIELGGLKADTSSCDFVIPYNFKLNLIEGTYSVPLGLRLLPGAEVNVAGGASVYIGGGNVQGGSLMVMDGLIQSDILNSVGARYPTRAELEAAGFSGSGELTVDGTLVMLTGSSLGGLIKSNGTGTIVIQDGVYLNNSGTLSKLNQAYALADQRYELYKEEGGIRSTIYGDPVILNWVKQDGSLGEYDENTTWYNLPARLYTAGGLITPQAGKTYTAVSGSGTVSYDVEYLYVADGVYGLIGNGKYGYLTQSGSREMTSATETVTHTLSAVWTDGSESDVTVSVNSITVAGSDKTGSAHNVTIDYDVSKNGANTVLSNLCPVDKDSREAKTEKYVYLVKYTVEGSAVGITVTPVDGIYTIPAEANGITIEACLLGDVNGDGSVKTADARAAYRAYANKEDYAALTELQILAADFNGDGVIKTADARNIYKLYLGK